MQSQPGLVPATRPRVADESQEAERQRKNAEWYNKRHPDGGRRLKAVQEKNRLAAAVSSTSGQWSPIGPQPIEWVYEFSGRVWGISVDPRNSSVIYVGTDGGGVWKTTNGGANWVPLTDTQANINIRDITLAPTAPDTVFAATTGGGLLKSTNGGGNWTTLLPGFFVNSISVHPANPSILLAAAHDFIPPPGPESVLGPEFSIVRSADGGSSWTTTFPSANANAVVFDPTNGNYAYVTTSSGLYRSTDSGVTWNLVPGNGLPSSPFGQLSLAIAPSSSNILYLAIKGPSGSLIGFYKSADGGATWARLGVPPNDDITYWGWYLRVHPTNPNVLYAGSLGLSLSLDGGKTWARNEAGLHVDHHVEVFSADGTTLFEGNDGGIWSTTNPSAANSTWTSLNNTLNTAMFYPGISINPTTPNTAFGGTQDNGVLQYQGTLPWRSVVCGDGGYTAIDFLQPQNVYASCDGLVEIAASSDGGNSFRPASSGVGVQDPTEFVPPMVMDPSNPSRLYYGTNRIYQTLNGANSWTAISSDLTAGIGGLATIAIAPSDPNTIYTGAEGGVLFVTQNALSGTGATWAPRNLPVSQAIFKIVVDPQNPLTAWAGGFGLDSLQRAVGPLYRTTDGGVTWSNRSSGLPSIPVNDIVLDPDVANTIYVATDVGVYRSADSGQSWLPLGAGLPNVVVNSILLYRPSRILRAATYGRGMWDLPIPASGQVAITIASTSVGAYFSLEDGTTYQGPFTFYWFTGAQHTVTWLKTVPGGNAQYLFTGWTDGASQNTRTIVVPSSAVTFTAILSAQYLLTVTLSPTQSGTVTLSPASANGYYNAGTTVQINVTPAEGYYMTAFSGDLSGSAPQSIVMNAPHNVTVNFGCAYSITGLPRQFGSASTSAFFEIETGSACPWHLTPADNWFAITSAFAGAGSATVAYTVAVNAGATRSTTLTFLTGFVISIAQDAETTGRPSVISMLPNSGTGTAQTFGYQFEDPNGYSNISQATMYFESQTSDPSCNVIVTQVSGGKYAVSLTSNGGSGVQGPVQLPVSTTLQNGQCSVDVSKVSVTGSGNNLKVTIAVAFDPTFTGSLIAVASAKDAVTMLVSAAEMLGTWIAYPLTTSVPVVVNSVANGASYQLAIAPNTWIAIQGTNLSQSTREWRTSDFVNGLLPTSLDGVSVTIDGDLGFISYISPTQINVLAPDDTKQGKVQVTVSNAAGASNVYAVNEGSVSPALFTFDSVHVAATHALGSYVGAVNSLPGVSTTPAAAGETVVLYATGFGTTNPLQVTGLAVTGVEAVANPVTVTIGGIAATVSFSGLIGPGLYQINVVVPSVPGGDVPIVASIMGIQTPPGVVIAIQQ